MKLYICLITLLAGTSFSPDGGAQDDAPLPVVRLPDTSALSSAPKRRLRLDCDTLLQPDLSLHTDASCKSIEQDDEGEELEVHTLPLAPSSPMPASRQNYRAAP